MLVGECVHRFASKTAPSLEAVISQQGGPLPLTGLVHRAFRAPLESTEAGTCIDVAFNGLRGLAQISEYVRMNNALYDSLSDLSDREAPELPNISAVASAILRDAKISPSVKS